MTRDRALLLIAGTVALTLLLTAGSAKAEKEEALPPEARPGPTPPPSPGGSPETITIHAFADDGIEVKGAEVRVNGARAGTTPLLLRAPDDELVVEATSSGRTGQVKVPPGSHGDIDVFLTGGAAKPPAPPPAPPSAPPESAPAPDPVTPPSSQPGAPGEPSAHAPGQEDILGHPVRGKSPLAPPTPQAATKAGGKPDPTLSKKEAGDLASFVRKYQDTLEQNGLTQAQAAAAALVYYRNNHGADPEEITALQEAIATDPLAKTLKASGRYDEATARATARVLKSVEPLARETAATDADALRESSPGLFDGPPAAAAELRIYFDHGGTDWRFIESLQEQIKEESPIRADGMMGPETLAALDILFPERGAKVESEDDEEK